MDRAKQREHHRRSQRQVPRRARRPYGDPKWRADPAMVLLCSDNGESTLEPERCCPRAVTRPAGTNPHGAPRRAGDASKSARWDHRRAVLPLACAAGRGRASELSERDPSRGKIRACCERHGEMDAAWSPSRPAVLARLRRSPCRTDVRRVGRFGGPGGCYGGRARRIGALRGQARFQRQGTLVTCASSLQHAAQHTQRA